MQKSSFRKARFWIIVVGLELKTKIEYRRYDESQQHEKSEAKVSTIPVSADTLVGRGWDDSTPRNVVCVRNKSEQHLFWSLREIIIRERKARQKYFWTMIEILFLRFHHGTILISEIHKRKWIWTIDGCLYVYVSRFCVVPATLTLALSHFLSLPLSQQGCVYVENFRRSFFFSSSLSREFIF